MDDKSDVIAAVCAALAVDQSGEAVAILRGRYPFVALTYAGRRYSVPRICAAFIRDGFIDRYSGARLVFPATLRLISRRLPDQFPFQTNWRTDACHFAFWELSPTIDHVIPVSRGGADDESNWVTTSMLRNGAKANFTLDELGWSLRPSGRMTDWDGLMGWFIGQVEADRALLSDPYLRQWFRAATQTLPLPL